MRWNLGKVCKASWKIKIIVNAAIIKQTFNIESIFFFNSQQFVDVSMYGLFKIKWKSNHIDFNSYMYRSEKARSWASTDFWKYQR
jgi:hypothetical protein